MTPWADVEGISVSGGTLAGVDLKPSGTEFLLPARLEITPTGGNPTAVESFAYIGEGRQAHRYPLNLDASKVLIDVFHFSGVGAYHGEFMSMPVAPAPPVDPVQALAAEMQRLIAEERARQLRGEAPDPEFGEKLEALMQSYYTNVVAPLLSGIRSDCTFAKANFGTVLSWARQAALLFGDGRFDTEQANVIDAVVAGAENCLDEALQPCVDQNDAAQMAEILAAWRQVLLLGGTEPDPPPLDPSRECKDVLAGTVTITYDKVLEVNGFRTEENYTITLNPRLLDTQQGYWYDDGRGSFSVTGGLTLEDLRGGDTCGTQHEYVYSGTGTFYAGPHPDQLHPEADRGRGKLELNLFHKSFEFQDPPYLTGEVVGTNTRTFHYPRERRVHRPDRRRRPLVPIPQLPGAGQRQDRRKRRL